MRLRPALLLAAVLALGATTGWAEAPSGDGTDRSLQATMQRLFELRTQDPRTFATEVLALERGAPPANIAQREFLQFLRAYRAALEGRFDEAIGLAKPIAESAEEPWLQLRAAAYVVNLRAGTREFEAGLRELRVVLESTATLDAKDDPALREAIAEVWRVAAIFYWELEKPELARWYARRLLDSNPNARNACSASVIELSARRDAADPALEDEDFLGVDALCKAANESRVLGAFSTIEYTRFLRDRGRREEALALMRERLGAIEASRYPRLIAEAYALGAELLLDAGRVADAERQAQRAVDTSKDLPTSLPVAMAERVLYEIHRQRGDSGAALRHLQRQMAANRALAEESLTKERAFRTVQHEALKREQQLVLAEEKNRVLDLEAQLAMAESRNAVALALVLLLSLAGIVAWGLRLWSDAERFRRLTQTDPLTGFATRQHFAELAAAALARHPTDDRPVMLVTFDLDHFKRINDHFGHLAGDAVLRAVSEAVRAVPAPVPRVVGRIGGEEFAVLLEGASPLQATAHADALRRAIAAARATVDGGATLSVTASFGITGTHECGHDLQLLLDRSDRALYRAKHDGRDRVIAADRDPRLAAT